MIADATSTASRVRVGPQDDGRIMSIDDFDLAIGEEGYSYELYRGKVQVSDVPAFEHLQCMIALRNALLRYEFESPGVIFNITGGGDSKVLLTQEQTERHPDISVYTEPPADIGQKLWSAWTPSIVAEVVSESSRKRDYEEKPDDYFEFGCAEYWIVDPGRQQLVQYVRSRHGWIPTTLKPGEKLTTTRLPGFELDVTRVLTAAKKP